MIFPTPDLPPHLLVIPLHSTLNKNLPLLIIYQLLVWIPELYFVQWFTSRYCT